MRRRVPTTVGRRTYLTGLTAGALTGLAGCTDADTDSGDDTSEASSDDASNGTDDGQNGSRAEVVDVSSLHGGYEYDPTGVRVLDESGDESGAVTAAIADTGSKRGRGLSRTESLPTDRGMLFVYDGLRENLTYIMPNMDFGIDIIYVDDEKTITSIHTAPKPGPNEDGRSEKHSYDGRGQYVLEVNLDWTTERGVEVGDKLAFEL